MAKRQNATLPTPDTGTQPRTLPYSAVSDVCCAATNQVQAIERVCNNLLGQHCGVEDTDLFQQLMLIRTSVQAVGGMLDHCIGGEIRGGFENWLGMPDMNQKECV